MTVVVEAGGAGENWGELLCWLIRRGENMEKTHTVSVGTHFPPGSFHWGRGLVTKTGAAVRPGPFLKFPNLLLNVISHCTLLGITCKKSYKWHSIKIKMSASSLVQNSLGAYSPYRDQKNAPKKRASYLALPLQNQC